MVAEGKYTLSISAFEMGVLMGAIAQAPPRVRDGLPDLWQQLVALRKQMEKDYKVTREYLPGGMVKLTDCDGNVIIREPYPWEVEGN